MITLKELLTKYCYNQGMFFVEREGFDHIRMSFSSTYIKKRYTKRIVTIHAWILNIEEELLEEDLEKHETQIRTIEDELIKLLIKDLISYIVIFEEPIELLHNLLIENGFMRYNEDDYISKHAFEK